MHSRTGAPGSNGRQDQLQASQNEAGDIQGGLGSPAVRMCTVKFSIKFHVGFGQSIRIIGHGPQLGNWVLKDAPALQWGPNDEWTVVLELPQSSVVEYKYVVMDSYGNAAMWQIGNNNILAIKQNQDELVVCDNWEGTPEASVEARGVVTSRQNQLMSWASEVQAMMTSTKNELRQSRLELMNAKEEARAAKVEVRHLRSELAEARLVAEKQRFEIKGLREEVYRAKMQLASSRKEHVKAFESASSLLEDMDAEQGSLGSSTSASSALPAGPRATKPAAATNTVPRGWEPPMENRAPLPAARPSPTPGSALPSPADGPSKTPSAKAPSTGKPSQAESKSQTDKDKQVPVTVSANGTSLNASRQPHRLRFPRFGKDQQS